jgi:hypothetical protein
LTFTARSAGAGGPMANLSIHRFHQTFHNRS